MNVVMHELSGWETNTDLDAGVENIILHVTTNGKQETALAVLHLSL